MSGAAARRPVVILISGRGSNMRSLIDAARLPDAPFRIAAVISDKPDAPGLALARGLGVETEALVPARGEDRAAYDRRLATAVARREPALVVLAGFMRILTAPFVDAFAGRMMNIHPSLLPKHAGLHTHRRAIEAGDTLHGATVHFVTAELDAGPPVIQARLEIAPGEDEAKLAERVLALEHRIYPLAVRWYCAGRLEWRDGRAWFDGAALEAPLQLTCIERE